MKARHIIPMTVLLAFGGAAALAQTNQGAGAPPTPNAQQLDQRFEQMSKMMGEAQTANGAQRMELMGKHMRLMQEQMQAMHSMMGGMMGGGMMGGQNGAGMMRGQNGGGMMGGGMRGGGPQMLAQMGTRMDMMQRMMEQMLDQMKMMTPSEPAK